MTISQLPELTNPCPTILADRVTGIGKLRAVGFGKGVHCNLALFSMLLRQCFQKQFGRAIAGHRRWRCLE